MVFVAWFLSAAFLFVSAAIAFDQQADAANRGVSIVQPGAPGHANRTLSPATAGTPPRTPTEADIAFMQGMIMHHAQAVEMTDLLRTRGRSKRLQALGLRISISQTDEINYMKQWLEERGQPAAMTHDMKGMSHTDKGSMPLMPGMLSLQQMKALAHATGAAFDRLFLTGMIQHHIGALVMVEDLFGTGGAGQDNVLYDFATDIDNTQRAEISIMQGMLKEKR